jgi:hypothetical protein
MLFMLYRHLLPPVDEIVIFSGFNDLVFVDRGHCTDDGYDIVPALLVERLELA